MLNEWMLVALASLALVPQGPQRSSQEPQRSPGVRRLTFVLEVDPEAARQAGWTRADGVDDGELVSLATGVLQRRFQAMGRAARITNEGKRIEVQLPSIDARDRELFEDLLRGIGSCEFLFLADGNPTALGIDLAQETHKLEAWRAAHPGTPLAAFDALPSEQDGPHARITWAETRFGGESGPARALLLPEQPADCLGAGSLARAYASADQFGYPAIGVSFRPSRSEDLSRLTASHVGQSLGIVIEGRLVSVPRIMAPLVTDLVIEGRLSASEAERLAGCLSSPIGPLRIVEVR